jgi:hypothetical protein
MNLGGPSERSEEGGRSPQGSETTAIDTRGVAEAYQEGDSRSGASDLSLNEVWRPLVSVTLRSKLVRYFHNRGHRGRER